MGMFFSRKKKAADAAARAEWMYPLKDHPALRIEHSSEPHKQSIRVRTSAHHAQLFFSNFAQHTTHRFFRRKGRWRLQRCSARTDR